MLKLRDIIEHYCDYPKDWIIAHNLTDLTDPETRENVAALWDELAEVGGCVYNLNVLAADLGAEYWVYSMDDVDEVFADMKPSELLRLTSENDFDPYHNYFSENIYGIYSGNDYEDFEELAELQEVLDRIKTDLEELLARYAETLGRRHFLAIFEGDDYAAEFYFDDVAKVSSAIVKDTAELDFEALALEISEAVVTMIVEEYSDRIREECLERLMRDAIQ